MFDIDTNNIILLVICLVIFGIIIKFETVFSYINIIEKNLFKEENEKNKKRVKEFLTNILKYRILLIILNILFYVLFIKKIFKIYMNLGIREYNIFYIIIFLIFYQIIMRVIAKRDIYHTLLINLKYINILFLLFLPIIIIFNYISKYLNNLINNGSDIENLKLDEEDIKIIINSDKTKDVEIEEKEMIHSIFSFTDTTVREIMTPRTSIVAFDKNSKLKDVLNEIIECEFSRIPIYSDSIDDIIGIINIKDLLKYIGDDENNLILENFSKKVIYIPETKNLIEMLEYFRKNQQHMAIIIDEYGGTLGLITIEDLLEEIVGEIRDEYDNEEDNFKKISSNIFEVLGETLVEDINNEYNINIEESEEYDTVSGYIQYTLGKVAKVNDRVVNEKYIIQVLEINNKKIEKIKLIIK